MLNQTDYQAIQLIKKGREALRQEEAVHRQVFSELDDKQNKTDVDEAVIKVLKSQYALYGANLQFDSAMKHIYELKDELDSRYQEQRNQINQYYNDIRQSTITHFNLKRNRIENVKVASIVAGIVFIVERLYSLISPLNKSIESNDIYLTIIFIFIATYIIGMIWWVLDKKIQQYNTLQNNEFVKISQQEMGAQQQLRNELDNDIKILKQARDEA